MPQQFKPGDVVHLKSGSCMMVVTYAEPDARTVGVAWVSFNTSTPHIATYPAVCLRHAEEWMLHSVLKESNHGTS